MSDFKKLPVGAAPTLEWQMQAVNEFSKLRMKVTTVRAKLEKLALSDDEDYTKFPATADSMWWRNYCLGSRKNANVPLRTPSTTSSDSSAQENGDVHQSAKADVPQVDEAHKPFVRDICMLSQEQMHKLLKYLNQWIGTLGFSDQIGVWIYSLLACIDKPLVSDIVSTLRTLSRTCSEARSKISPEDALFKALNLIICIVGRYYEQLDIADD